MALFGAAKALNEGFFHIIVLGMAIYLAVNGRANLGDVLDLLHAVPQRDGAVE